MSADAYRQQIVGERSADMALTDESTGFTMPVMPAYGYGNNGGGLFGGGGSWLGILFLIALCNGGFGFGGFGGYGAMGMMNGMWGGYGIDYLYPWLNNSEHISDGFRDQQLSTQVGNIQNAITSGFGDVQTALCGGFAGVNSNITQTGSGIVNALNSGFSSAEIAANGRQMSNMQSMFGIQSAIQNCCCENRAATADLKYTVATEACADRAAISDALRDVIAANTASTQRILDQLCADKIESKNDTIAQLRSELLYARGQASQDVQTAAIQAGQRALANEVEQYVAPRAIPAYMVQNPNCCYNPCGTGCGV